MRINSYITTLLAAGAAAFAIAAAPMAAAAPTGTTNAIGSTVHQTTAMPRSPLGPARLHNRPPSCSNHSAGIWAPCCSTTSGAGAGPDGTENDRALRAGSSQSRLTAIPARTLRSISGSAGRRYIGT